MQSDDPVMPRAASVSGAVQAGEEPDEKAPSLTLAQADALLLALRELEPKFPWLTPLIIEFGWAADQVHGTGTVCECEFQIEP